VLQWHADCEAEARPILAGDFAEMMTENELNLLAAYMVDTHGRKALQYADAAVLELEQIGELLRADAWRSLKEVVLEMVDGRRSKAGYALH
jgi:hypothetical protein